MTLDQSISLGTGIDNQALKWRHNEHDGVSSLQRLGCLLTRLFRRRSKKPWKLRFLGLCEGNSSVTGAFPSQRASNAEKFPFNDVIVISIYICGASIARTKYTQEPVYAYMRHGYLVITGHIKKMTRRLFGARPPPMSVLICRQLDSLKSLK